MLATRTKTTYKMAFGNDYVVVKWLIHFTNVLAFLWTTSDGPCVVVSVNSDVEKQGLSVGLQWGAEGENCV